MSVAANILCATLPHQLTRRHSKKRDSSCCVVSWDLIFENREKNLRVMFHEDQEEDLLKFQISPSEIMYEGIRFKFIKRRQNNV